MALLLVAPVSETRAAEAMVPLLPPARVRALRPMSGGVTNQLPPIAAPAIIDDLEDRTVTSGDILSLQVSIAGTTPLIYRWFRVYRVSGGLGGGEFFLEAPVGESRPGTNEAELLISPVRAVDAGRYMLIVSNREGVDAKTFSITVLPRPQSVTFEMPSNPRYGDPPFPVVASASSGGAVSVSVEGAAILREVQGVQQLEWTRGGPVTVSVAQTGSADHAAVTTAFTFEVARAPQTISHEVTADVPVGSGPVAVVARSSAGLPVTIQVVDGPARFAASDLLDLTGEGVVVLRATAAGDDRYLDADPVTWSFRVVPAAALRVEVQRGGTLPGLVLILRGSPLASVFLEGSTDLRVWSTVQGFVLNAEEGLARTEVPWSEAVAYFRVRSAN